MYRSTSAENSKPRPGYYSKDLALASLLRATETLARPYRIHFLNDGRIPEPRAAAMRAHGTVRPIDGGSNRRTYRAALAAEAALALDDDLIWFAEDDYLYRPDAFTTLEAAASTFPAADYFCLYGSDALDPSASRCRGVLRPEPGAEGDQDAPVVGSARWYRAYATTSTFGVRARALRKDAPLLRFMPWTGGAFDLASCLAVQGYRPFGMADLLGDDGLTPRTLVRALVRIAADVRAVRRPSRRRVLLGSDPELVWHMEVHEADSRSAPSPATTATEWDAVAADTARWAAGRSLPVRDLGASALR